MENSELMVAGLLLAVAALTLVASRVSLPYPIVLVLGGAALGFLPGFPSIDMDPDVVLVVFLPLLLYRAAFFANFTDIRRDFRGLTLNAIGLVLVTMTAVACAAHALIPGLPWGAAFALGAIVSPTDPLAATTIMRRVSVPRRIVSAVDGEGLFNDATALVAYRAAVAAVVAGGFSLAGAGVTFVLAGVGGVAIGLVVGWAFGEIRRRTSDAQISITLSLLTGYAAFIPADVIGASGVLAAVTAGIVMGFRGPRTLPARIRLQGYFVWDILDFVMNAVLFVLIGLQLRSILGSIGAYPSGALAVQALAVSAVVVGVRLAWFLLVPPLSARIGRRADRSRLLMSRDWRVVIGWSGMRGAVSLAVALALPLTTDDGQPFPERDRLLFLTFAVIFTTLVGQGLTLPALIRRLGITDEGAEEREETRTRLVTARAAIAQIDALAGEDWTRDDTIRRLRNFYEYRKQRFAARAGTLEDDRFEDRTLAYQRVVREVIEAQRRALLDMRSSGELSEDMMNRILRELDLEDSRLEI